MPRLAGLSALVTGGGSGLGRAIVDRYITEGATVTVLERSSAKLDDLVTTHGDRVRAVQGDVTSTSDNALAVSTAVKAFGGLDTFVGNAGLWDFGRELLSMTPPELDHAFDELFAVNVKGYLIGARAAAEAVTARRGSMIFTLSNAALYPRGGGVLYTASKRAAAGLVSQLAYELAPHVRVNGVAPGGMATDLRGPRSMALDDTAITDVLADADSLSRYSALDFTPRAEDYVDSYVLLAARRESRTVTGAVFDISAVGTPRRPDLPV
ncbi:3-(cis-5,6-dihydroxycyclohexa-1,3-dien-1-yl)propanoate dehydrogenase [Lentzea cavernae]|uniref:3-phenylpropionate-dihydrodiol/cinnamic acid-dihydrodiol dehydrogenase n=1 Tax=Lentzea cavernae TaxID=2020703 RepID=A0ABQ3M665_9PSEU|nr:3-(cis-5,6-dihydroxycyclohexa-1,3-dien-1-yl)propanoate dehydrogenase [Lentzea cavernae]GHH34715.1 3-phenylpropionate-dihydrodiol/cinnamic acid-dihydrodiol dehydrogenase [Lentzea cavernae]